MCGTVLKSVVRVNIWKILAIFCWLGGLSVSAVEPSRGMLDLNGPDALSRLKTEYNARVETVSNDPGHPCLRVQTPASPHWPGITLPAPNGVWDLSNFATVEITVRNT
ncbi:MAG TPA: hypothetical protein PLA90_06050, partial [Candidatus Sumerlaeota bacterium]|nr:hypothetical protein [Candidatus Sumerlaeota bacterium]